MIDATITIRGPGGCLTKPIDAVVTALQQAGVEVVINDEYPASDEQRQRIKETDMTGWRIVIVAEHLPWGG